MCAGLCPTYWTTFGIAEKNRNGSCPQHEWDHPQFFEFLTPPPPAPRGRWIPQGKGHVGRHCPYTNNIWCMDPCTRCWDIAQKPPKCKNSPLTPIVTKISFASFSARRGRQPPKAEKTRPNPGYALMQNMAWIGPRVAEKSLIEQTNKQTYSKTNTSPFALRANGG